MFGSQPLVCVSSVPPFKVVSIVGVVSRMWEAFGAQTGICIGPGKLSISSFRFFVGFSGGVRRSHRLCGSCGRLYVVVHSQDGSNPSCAMILSMTFVHPCAKTENLNRMTQRRGGMVESGQLM